VTLKETGVLKMKRYYGGEVVKSGIYLSLRRKDLITIENEGDSLVGENNDSYVNVPPLAMILVGPFIGLIYVIFLPFISFAMILGLAARRVWLGVRQIGESLLGVATANWRPGVAYFGRGKQSRKRDMPRFCEKPEEGKEAKTPDLLSELEKEIERKRKGEGKA
jgi:hypothetical protein